jgi:glycerol kinase
MDDTTKVQLLALTAAAGASLASFWLAKSQATHSSSSSSSSTSSTKNKLASKHFAPPFVGALDQGTSSTRFIVFDSRTNIVVSHQMELPPLYPQPGYTIANYSCLFIYLFICSYCP